MRLALGFFSGMALAFTALAGTAEAGIAEAGAAELEFRSERLPLELSSGRRLEVELRTPADLRPGERLPLLLVFGGFERAGEVLSLLKPSRRVALASFDYPFDPPRRFSFPGSLRHIPALKRMILDTREGITRLARALPADRAASLDPARVLLVGASLGTPFVLAAAARAPEVAGLVLIHPVGDPPRTTAARLERALGSRLAARGIAHALWWYLGIPSPEQDAGALRPGLPVFWVRPERDSLVPRESVDALEAALAASPARVERWTTPGDHLMPGSEALIARILERTARWMERERLVGVR